MSKICKICNISLDISLFGKGSKQCNKCRYNKLKCKPDTEKSKICKICNISLDISLFGKGSNQCKKCIYNKRKCEHGTQKNKCKKCDGSQVCEHGIRRSTCKKCGGSSICEHGIQRSQCIICNPDCACIECKSILVDKRTHCYPLCQACFCNKYPDHKKSTLYKIKERYLRDELINRFPDADIKLIFDKIVDGGCSRRRPDVLIDMLLYSIVIECDENQHKNYECENKRTMQLFEDLGSRPLILIRFNPDGYIDSNNNKLEGCFKPLTKIEDVHKKKFYDLNEGEWTRRMDILEKVIREKINIPSKEIDEIKLFYDGEEYKN